jgi:predicted kinase
MKELILLRGLPGSGKSTFAKLLSGNNYEADKYFERGLDNVYEFNPSKLKNAHEWCRDLVFMDMVKNEPRIVVSNTFTQEWEMDAYYELAKQYGYRVHSIIMENRHDGVNEHGVPEDKLEQMKNRFEIKI